MTKGLIIECKIDTKKHVLQQRKQAPENQGDTKMHFYSQNLDFLSFTYATKKEIVIRPCTLKEITFCSLTDKAHVVTEHSLITQKNVTCHYAEIFSQIKDTNSVSSIALNASNI